MPQKNSRPDIRLMKNASCVEDIHPTKVIWASLIAQLVKNPPAMWETRVQSLGWKDSLEEGMATHSSILVWRIPMDRGAWQATGHGVAKSQTLLSD